MRRFALPPPALMARCSLAALPLLAACVTSPGVDRTAGPLRPVAAVEKALPPAPAPPAEIPREPMPAAERAFRWPASGTVVERNGTSGIALRASGDVVAAKSGVVELIATPWAGLRNLIIVRHADGFLSLYADADEILVPMGKAVRQGDPIARFRSGGILHFRLARETQAVDPMAYLR